MWWGAVIIIGVILLGIQFKLINREVIIMILMGIAISSVALFLGISLSF